MLTTSEKVNEILGILGFDEHDQSFEASYAQMWVMATLDDDEGWFEGRGKLEIRQAYQDWVESVS